MSAAAVLSAVITRIAEFLLEDGAPATIGNDFKEKLRTLVPYLCEVVQLFEVRDKDFAKEVIQLAYDIEDAVEREALLNQGVHVSSRSRIKYLTLNGRSGNKARLQRYEKRLGVLIKQYPKYSLSTVPTVVEPRSISLPKKNGEDETIGLEDDLDKLVGFLTGGSSSSISKMAIVGMAGVGKTTLARELFDHPVVKDYFDIWSWARASQESNVITVVRSILQDISLKGIGDLSCLGEKDLKAEFYDTLVGRRCLVILDDIWSIKVWEEIKRFFPDHNKDSRVVITTRDEEVARIFEGDVHRVDFLTHIESDKLLEKKLKLHHSDMNKNASLRSTANTIISMCQGLPSEIIRIVDILNRTELKKWEKVVHKLLKSEMVETSLLQNIALSYDYLQPHLKPCFLSLGQFPSDQPIPVEKLQLMWKAERFTILKENGESYLRELADRNLILDTHREVLTGKLVSCQLQLMTRKLCKLKAKEEGFAVDSQHGSTAAHRAVIYVNGNVKKQDIISNLDMVKDSRALLFFSDNGSRLLAKWPGKFSELERFKRARVLDFDGIDFRAKKQSTCKGKLLHLRYLSFARCWLEKFPFSYCLFPFLETLDLRVRTKMKIPNVIWEMSNLQFLYFPAAYECKTQEKIKLKGAKKLEVVENFHAGICDVDDLPELKNLQNLIVISEGENTELKKLIGNVQEINKFHSRMKSSLIIKDFDCYSSDRLDTFKELLECDGIQNLYFEGSIRNMPRNMNIAQTFTDIVFCGTEFREDPMSLLGELESLKSLVLCNDAINVEEVSCCETSFPELKSLEINSLQSLKLWVVEYGSMPALTDLTIRDCHNLVTLPQELMEIGLSRINIGSMSQEFKENFNILVQQQPDLGNDIEKLSIIIES